MKKAYLISLAVLGLASGMLSCNEKVEVTPRLNTLETIDSDITTSTAILKGDVQILGNMNITEYGVEYSKSMLFSPSDRIGLPGSPSTGIFQVVAGNLESKTTYYYKAYALINTAYIYSQNYNNFTTK